MYTVLIICCLLFVLHSRLHSINLLHVCIIGGRTLKQLMLIPSATVAITKNNEIKITIHKDDSFEKVLKLFMDQYIVSM